MIAEFFPISDQYLPKDGDNPHIEKDKFKCSTEETWMKIIETLKIVKSTFLKTETIMNDHAWGIINSIMSPCYLIKKTG